MNQIIEFLFLRSDSLFDSFTIAQTIVHVLILVLDFIIWTAFHSLIPWIVAIVKKKPMTKKMAVDFELENMIETVWSKGYKFIAK